MLTRRTVSGWLLCAALGACAVSAGCTKPSTPEPPATEAVVTGTSSEPAESAPAMEAVPTAPPADVVEAADALVQGVLGDAPTDGDSYADDTGVGSARRWLPGDLDGDGTDEWVEQIRATEGSGDDATRMTFVVVSKAEDGPEARWLLREDDEPRWAERAQGVTMGEFTVEDATGDGKADIFWCGVRQGHEDLHSWGIWSLTDLAGDAELRLRDVARIKAPTFDRSVTPWKISRKMTGEDAGQLTNTGARILDTDGKAFLDKPVERENMVTEEFWKFEDGVFKIGTLRVSDGSLDIITHFEPQKLGEEAGRWGDPELFKDFKLFPEYK